MTEFTALGWRPSPCDSTDILARLVGQWLSARLGQQFIVENKPGAATNIGTEEFVRAPADGHTLLLFGAPSAINATLYPNLSFNFLRDVAPVASLMSVPNVMVAHPSFPARTVLELIAYAKANPGKIKPGPPTSSQNDAVARRADIPQRSVQRILTEGALRALSLAQSVLEHFQEKWKPVFRPKMRRT